LNGVARTQRKEIFAMRTRIVMLTLAVAGIAAAVQAGSIAGTVQVSGVSSAAGAVVYIDRIEGQTFEPPPDPVVMDQKGKVFEPRVLPVLVGTTVDFLNSDPFTHNVFTPDPCPESFDLGGWATGEIRSHTFSQPCVATILCNTHPEMDGYVLALETPYFAVTGPDGGYRINEVPDGDYTVVVWHERLRKNHTASVLVSGETEADFVLKR
jgi:plastocyanin